MESIFGSLSLRRFHKSILSILILEAGAVLASGGIECPKAPAACFPNLKMNTGISALEAYHSFHSA